MCESFERKSHGKADRGRWLRCKSSCKGDLPQMSNIKHDVLAGKVEKQRKFTISKDERRAATIIDSFPIKLQRILTAYEEKRNKHNPYTGKVWTHDDIAACLRLRRERYKKIRVHLFELVIEVDASEDIEDTGYKMRQGLKFLLV